MQTQDIRNGDNEWLVVCAHALTSNSQPEVLLQFNGRNPLNDDVYFTIDPQPSEPPEPPPPPPELQLQSSDKVVTNAEFQLRSHDKAKTNGIFISENYIVEDTK